MIVRAYPVASVQGENDALRTIIDIQQAALRDALTPEQVLDLIAHTACEISAADGRSTSSAPVSG